MKITFADSFWKSLDRLSMQQSWWYKTYEVFRYKIPMFFKNLWFFRKELWEFRSWDYSFNLRLFARSLEKTVNTIEFHGHEIESSKKKKVEKIRRVIHLIKNMSEDLYLDMAQKELGEIQNLDFFSREDTPEEEEHNRKIFERSTEIERQEWNEFIKIIKGQDLDEFKKLYDGLSEKEKSDPNLWENWFDGSGIKNWWD